MLPSKVEVVLCKVHHGSWGKLEDPSRRPQPPAEEPLEDAAQSSWDIADDDISDSDEDWAYDTPENQGQRSSQDTHSSHAQNLHMKDVEDEMTRAAEERRRLEEAREAQRRHEAAEGFQDMPDLE